MPRVRLHAVLASLAMLPLGAAALAQTPPPAPSAGGTGTLERGVAYGESGEPMAPSEPDVPGRPLAIEEAIAYGLLNNLDVEVNRYQPYVSQLESEAAWGAYDPTFAGDVRYSDSQTRNLFSINQALFNENEFLGGTAGVSALVPYWGASVRVGLDSGRAITNNTLQGLSPQYDTGLTLGGSVPLLRGLLWNQAWTQVKLSRLGRDADLDLFTAEVMNTVQSIISAYWDLVATKELVRVKEKSLESNRALLDQTETQYDVGVVSKVEVVQAEAGVANSEFELIVARNDYRNAQDQLIAAVLGDRLLPDTTLTFDPTTTPEFTDVPPVDLNQAVGTAFTKRPELSAAERRLDQGEVQLRFAKNQRLPQVDLNVSYRTFGTEGPQNPALRVFTPGGSAPAPPNTVRSGTYGDTYCCWFGGLAPNELQATGVVSIPLGNVTARKNVTKAEIELRRAESQISRLKQQIIVSVRSAARGLLASAEGVEAAERRRIAAAEQLRAEKIRLEHGESTPYDVLLRENDLVEAESQKILALRSFRNAQATLERQQGTILDTWNVAIEGVRKLEYAEPLASHRRSAP